MWLDENLKIANYDPVNLDEDPNFHPYFLEQNHQILVIPSAGLSGTNILSSKVERMIFLQIAECIAMGNNFGAIVNFLNLPPEEEAYREKLFPGIRPEWISLHTRDFYDNLSKDTVVAPLDQTVAENDEIIALLREKVASMEKPALYGYYQTQFMRQIAEMLDIPYYGTPEFAAWAGSKVGLQEFLDKYDLPSPHTFKIETIADIANAIDKLLEIGYERGVFKVNFSTRGLGQRIVNLQELKGDLATKSYEEILPPDHYSGEGVVLQGWIEEEYIEGMASVDILIDLLLNCHFIHHKTKYPASGRPLTPAGYLPIHRPHLEGTMAIKEQLAKAYINEKAIGPHSINMIFLTEEGARKFGFKYGLPLIHDENTRIGVSKIAHNWTALLRGGKAGAGWIHTPMYLGTPKPFAEVLEILENAGLLITNSGPDAHGIFVYEGIKLDTGMVTFKAIAISKNGDINEAGALLDKAKELLGCVIFPN
jgi:hypothetical protein